jgi:Gelsolin repeat
MFCSAMYAVGLRNWLETTCKVHRETKGDESEEFLRLFPTIEYQDASEATERYFTLTVSGLFQLEEKSWPIRLYRIYGVKELRLCLMEPSASSLESTGVYILDWGLECFQWNGLNASLQHKSKCRMVCQRINKGDRQGKADFLEVDEGEESERFWGILNQRISKYTKAQMESFKALSETTNTLYRVTSVIEDIEKHVVGKGLLKKELLKEDGCYIVDAGVEIFMWMGKEADPLLKSSTNDFLSVIYGNFRKSRLQKNGQAG